MAWEDWQSAGLESEESIQGKRVCLYEAEGEYVHGVVTAFDIQNPRMIEIRWDDGKVSMASMDRGLLVKEKGRWDTTT